MITLTKANDPVNGMDMQSYSDVYKSLHGIRPRWASFANHGEFLEAYSALLAQSREYWQERDAFEAEQAAEALRLAAETAAMAKDWPELRWEMYDR